MSTRLHAIAQALRTVFVQPAVFLGQTTFAAGRRAGRGLLQARGQLLMLGVAGGLGPGVQVGDVVVASELLQHDLDASPIFPRHQIPGRGLSRIPTCPTLSNALFAAARQTLAVSGGQQVHEGLIVSGDRFVSSAAEAQALQAELPDALAVEMEGAAIAQVCLDFGLPFGVVRSISDRADDTAHVDFTRFVREVASPHALAIVQAALAHLPAA